MEAGRKYPAEYMETAINWLGERSLVPITPGCKFLSGSVLTSALDLAWLLSDVAKTAIRNWQPHEDPSRTAYVVQIETALRDACIGHADDCSCRGCGLAFKAGL